MSTVVQVPPPRTPLKTLPVTQDRGVYAMWCVIATEAMLFAAMFASYYYLGNNKIRWRIESAPSLVYPWFMFGVILVSNLVLYWGHRRVNAESFGAGRIAIWVAFVLGAGFLALQGFEIVAHWRYLTPVSDSYGSIFYTIEFLFVAHMVVGMLLLGYVGLLPNYAPTLRTPHKPYQTVAAYWYFLGVLWLFIAIFLYSIPNIQSRYYGH